MRADPGGVVRGRFRGNSAALHGTTLRNLASTADRRFIAE